MKSSRKQAPGVPRKAPQKNYDSEKHLRLFCDATSHELATALGTIVGELDYALATQSETAKERSQLVAISAAERALSLARNLRYFSVHTKLNIQAVDLSQILLDSVELIEKELELNQIKITVLAEASTYAQVDPGAIQQVVLNLLAHARKALPKGGKVTLSLRQNNDNV
jgi:two-component system cell cycle sensor histidine kinase/response regulator CckA